MNYDQWKIDAPDNSSPEWIRAITDGVYNIIGEIGDIDESIDGFDDESDHILVFEARIIELKDEAISLIEDLEYNDEGVLAGHLTYEVGHSSRYV